MALRESGARYVYGLSRLKIRALNDDLSTPAASNMIGGAGPFDFSTAVAPAAVTAFVKADAAAVEDFTINLSSPAPAGGISAVTVDELVTAINAGLAAHSPAITGWTASKQSVTNRIKLVHSTAVYTQFYGEAARLSMFGQGRGLKAIKSNTAKTLSATPSMKDDETKTTTDANGKDTEVIIEGYRKGFTGSMVDSAEDFEMMELIESGVLSSDGLTYTAPASTAKKVLFEIEAYNPLYSAGTNDEDQIAGWEKRHYLKVKGSIGEDSAGAEFADKTYNLVGTNYKTPAGVESGAIITTRLAVTAWSPEAFDLI